MVMIAEFTVEPDSFQLGTVFETLPGAELELERLVPTTGALIPYMWLRDAHTDDVVAAFGRSPEVTHLELVDEIEDEYLLRIEWDADADGVLKAIANTPVSLLSAIGTSDEWRFELRAEDTTSLSDFQTKCRTYGVSVELISLHTLSPMHSNTEYELTDTQREALILAWNRGFYQTPREATLEEVAADLGITGQSLGSRLRRGTHRLIASTLISPSSSE